MGIEPTYQAWKASVLPLNYAREHDNYSYLSGASQRKLAHKPLVAYHTRKYDKAALAIASGEIIPFS